jgi:tripartite-type tricarboxylate transporter receptor subunit TctC
MKKIIIFLVGLLICLPAAADPSITLVVPMSPGGPADALARTLEQTLTTAMNRSRVVEVRAGAAGEIGAGHVAKQDRGTVLLLASVSLATANTEKNKSYDIDQDLQPIFYFGHMPAVLVTSSRLPYQNFQDLQKIKKTLSYASGGVGTTSHLTGAELGRILQKDMIHVPYKGAGQAITDLIGGIVDLRFVAGSVALPYVQSGQLRALAVVSDQRLLQYPQIPTFRELGYENFGFKTWFMLLANKNANAQDLIQIRQILQQTLADSKTAQPYRNLGLEYRIQDLDQAGAMLKKEIIRYRQFYHLNPEYKADR